MKNFSKVAILMLTLSLVLSACGTSAADTKGQASDGTTGSDASASNSSASTAPVADEETYTITMAYGVGAIPADNQMVQDKISEITKEKINAQVELMAISFSAYTQQINLMLSGGEKLDLMLQFGSTLASDVAKGQLLPLDDLLASDGQAIVAAVGEDFLKADTVRGSIYAVPSIRDMAAAYGVTMRKDLLDKYGFTVDDVKTTDDMEKVFAAVKAGEPDMAVTWSQGATISVADQLLMNRDSLGDGFGVLQNRGQDNLTVVNWYETDEYKAQLALMRKWYEAGYILADAPTNKEPNSALVKAGKLFSFCANIKPGFDIQSTNQCNYEMVVAEISPAFTTTTQVSVISWSLPVTCGNQLKTLQYLNMMYENQDVVNLLDWGVEGTHYVKTEVENVITYPEGVDASNTGYGLNYGWMFGNQLISHTWQGDDPTLYTQLKDFNDNAIRSKALGFQFDASNVKTEVAAVTQVQNQYKFALEDGAIDPEENLPLFIKDLKAAGIDTIVAEKQRQLDEWAATQN